jgi:steroid 5-alpha reductase family enzyme
MNDLLILLGGALAGVVVEMTLTWLVADRLRNYGIVDAVWSAGFAGLALWYLAGSRQLHADATLPLRSGVMTGMVLLWSLRLAYHLARRIVRHHPREDVRYAELRREWGPATRRKMYGFFLLQGALQVVLSLPFLWVCLNPNPTTGPGGLTPFEWTGLALWILGWTGEAIADRQLARFVRNPANRGQVCQSGLWYWSRHPNYFFEWLIWVGFAVFALGSPLGWTGLLSPLLMWHFLVNVTGIPMTEALSLRSKGDAYRQYQATTSAFVPWFKKSAAPPSLS